MVLKVEKQVYQSYDLIVQGTDLHKNDQSKSLYMNKLCGENSFKLFTVIPVCFLNLNSEEFPKIQNQTLTSGEKQWTPVAFRK